MECYVSWVICLAVASCVYIFSSYVNAIGTRFLSVSLNYYLSWRHPIHHVDGKNVIPSCRYQWPDGQGDEAKFLQGTSRSQEWREKYGPVFRLWSGMNPEIVVSSPEAVRDVFKDSHRHMKAISNDSGYLFGEILGSCVGLISGKAWEAVREAFSEPFTRPTMLRSTSTVVREVEKHFSAIERSENLIKGLINPAQDLKMLAFIIIARSLYGPLDKDAVERLEVLAGWREDLFLRVMKGGISRFHWSKYLPLKANALLSKFRSGWKDFNNTMIANQKCSNKTAPVAQIWETVNDGTITEEQFYQTIDEILFANLDVTLGGLSWSIMFLAGHPEYQEKLRKESGHAKTNDGLPSYLSDNTTLLSACILEASRLKPAAAFSVPQSCPTDRTIGGFVVPAGTNIVVDSHMLNIENEYWGKDGDTYRPERFLGKGRATDFRYNFWRFGFGPRQCLGKYMADLIIKATLLHLIENYDLAFMGTDDGVRSKPEVWINHPEVVLQCVKR
ncbi:unnamed protein product [Periconia digitata]|uniref:Cytochrome P450 monooxygenase n=1 Tax=Periconia digitata TaxID=1303443 RepID=A0A9W4XMV1_9PLEO|nr:unnamed protein product [Periconia digitata]